MSDVAIVIVSHSDKSWLEPCLESVFSHAGGRELDVIVVCNGNDGSAELVERAFPKVRVIRSANRGFAHACNQGLRLSEAPYAVLLNPDTQVLEGTFGDLVAALEERPSIGVAGVRQLNAGGQLLPTMRRFPTALRALGEAFGSEHWPLRGASFGERELDLRRYETEQSCDWISGSFLALRRNALTETGLLDERFFLYSEEPDLCLRVKRAGWEVCHLPVMTIVHHAGRASENARLQAQQAYARWQFAVKHFSRLHRAAYTAALGAGYAIRATAPLGRSKSARRRKAARAALRVVLHLDPPPFDPGHAAANGA